jgi:hypothetical protein
MIFRFLNIGTFQEEEKLPKMSFCDFAENVEDAMDHDCVYDYYDETGLGEPQLLWLSDIPLFQPTKPFRPTGYHYLQEEDNDTELQCTYQSQRPEQEEERKEEEKRRIVLQKPEYFNDTSFTFTRAEVPVTFEIVRQILTCVRNLEYSFEAVNGDYQINVSIGELGDETRFAMNFYQEEIPGQTFVEINFNSGRRIDFLKFYREFTRHLNDVGFAPKDDTTYLALPTDVFSFTPIYQEDVKKIEQDVKLHADLSPEASAEPVDEE